VLQSDHAGFVQMQDNDYETLADFEEELSRRGHYDLLFPLSSNIETYKGYFN